MIPKPETKEITSDLIQVEKQAFKKVFNSIQSYLQINGTSEAVLRSKIEAIFKNKKNLLREVTA